MPPNKRFHCSIIIIVIIIMRVRLFFENVEYVTQSAEIAEIWIFNASPCECKWMLCARCYFHFSSFCFVGVCRFRHPPPVLNGVVVLFLLPHFAYSHLFRSQSIGWLSLFSRIPRKTQAISSFWVKYAFGTSFVLTGEKLNWHMHKWKRLGYLSSLCPIEHFAFILNLSARVCSSFGWIQGSPIFRYTTKRMNDEAKEKDQKPWNSN